MKKIISLILCIALITLVLVSCGDEKHVHQYNRDEWAFDASNHWYAAECDCKDAGTKNLAAHVDSMNDGYCDICNYLMCGVKDHSTELSYNDNAHWYNANCTHNGQNSHILPKDFSEHIYSEADDGRCTICNFVCTNVLVETDEWKSDATNHWHESACGHMGHFTDEQLGKGAHTDTDTIVDEESGDEIVVGNGVCDVCGYVSCKGEYAETGTYVDEKGHVYEITCGHTGHEIKSEAHVDVKGATDEDGVEVADGLCDVCFGDMPTVSTTPEQN